MLFAHRSRKLTASSKIRSLENESIRITSTEGTFLDRESDGAMVENFADGGTFEVEITGSINDNLGSPIKQANDAPLEKMDTELADSGDDVFSSTAIAKKGIGGRSLRVVFDDDED
ncbi:hypothetical protein NL676_031382 [Syzygium grande]|nr:hypothetical protein NL676_031382 [Syzygium grande]